MSMSFRTIPTALGALATALLVGLSACGGGGDELYADAGSDGISGTGIVRMSITDAPACGFDEVNVTVSKVLIHQDSDADDSDDGWQEIVLAQPKRVDLLTLTNGVLEELGEKTVPAGHYSQLRLVLADNADIPLANTVVPTGGDEIELDTPSGQQSGLKINVDMDVAADQVADFAIDFDACKSVVKRGNSGHYNLKPVLSVIPIVSDAGMRVVGYVDPLIANAGTTVSVQQNGVPVKATVPDAEGRFVLYPVPAGTYDLVISAADRATAVMTGVPVVTASYTTVNSSSFAFLPAPSVSATVTGTVTPTSATVRALQSLTGGPTLEVAWATVNTDTGLFSVALPTQAPVKTAYVVNATTAYSFTADDAVAGLYALEAAYSGASQSVSVDTAALTTPIAITFP